MAAQSRSTGAGKGVLIAFMLGLAAVWSSPAAADPPDWAPAHGYRAKHKNKTKRPTKRSSSARSASPSCSPCASRGKRRKRTVRKARGTLARRDQMYQQLAQEHAGQQ